MSESADFSLLSFAPLAPESHSVRVGSLTQINDNTIACATLNKTGGIMTFDVSSDQWTLHIPYAETIIDTQIYYIRGAHPNKVPWDLVHLTYVPNKNTFYLLPTEHGSTRNGLCSLCISIHQQTKATKAQAISLHADHIVLGTDNRLHCISRKGSYHKVFGLDENGLVDRRIKQAHYKVGVRIKRYVSNAADLKDVVESWGGTAVYISSKGMFLLIGGCYNRPHKNPANFIPTIDPEPTGEIFGGTQNEDGSWNWELIAEDGPKMTLLNAVVTADERYIIVSYVHSERWSGDIVEGMEYVHVLDVENGCECRRSSVKIPIDPFVACEGLLMFRTGNDYISDVTVQGFIRRQYGEQEFKGMKTIPLVLIPIIQRYFSTELIHWIAGERHFAIAVDEILLNVS